MRHLFANVSRKFTCFAICLVAARQWAAQPLMTHVAEALALSPAALQSNLPARFQGVVTCVDRSYKVHFIQDDTGGIFLYRFTSNTELAPGDIVEATGTIAAGLFAPTIDGATVAVVGKTNLPPARPASLAAVASGGLVGQRVEVSGIVERIEKLGDHLWLQINEGDTRCFLSVLGSESLDDPRWLDARVRARGVAGAAFKKQELNGFQLFVNSVRDVEVIEAAPTNVFNLPPRQIASLSRFWTQAETGHRVHLRGVVTLHWDGRETVLQDGTGGIGVERGLRHDIEPGTEVDVAAFVSRTPGAPQLRNLEVRVLGKREVTPELASTDSFSLLNQRLVRIAGRIITWQPPIDGFIVGAFEVERQVLGVRLPARGAPHIEEAFPPGSTVNLVGVLKSSNEAGAPQFAVWMRGASEITLIQPPPIAMRTVFLRFAWGALTLAAAVLAVLAVLYGKARKRAATAVAGQQEAEQQFEEVQRQLRHARRDRERMTQELHDNIIQSIFAVGISLDEVRRKAESLPARVSERLAVAVESLNGVIRDVRAFIRGGEPKSLDGPELKAALKSVLLTSGVEEQRGFLIEIDNNAARELTSLQATELFNIAREAMYNSIRHAHATQTTVTLTSSGSAVELEVRDDGVGFSRDRVSAGSMGLRNMESRAGRIGAELKIVSSPGAGTRVAVEVPIASYASR